MSSPRTGPLRATGGEDERIVDQSLRPLRFDEYVGQERVKENLQLMVTAARGRGDVLDHLLLDGPPGLGKTSLAYLIAREMGVNIRTHLGPGDRAPRRRRGDPHQPRARRRALHRRDPPAEPRGRGSALPRDGGLPARPHRRPGSVGASTSKLELQPFTLVAATTRTGLLTSPLRDRFGRTSGSTSTASRELEPDPRALGADPDGAARNRRRGGDCAPLARHAAHRQPAAATCARLRRRARRRRHPSQRGREALELLDVDDLGLEPDGPHAPRAIIDKFGGGPVGLDTLAASVGEERDTIEDVYEPYLLQSGFLQRTAKGRVATSSAWRHLGRSPARIAGRPVLKC